MLEPGKGYQMHELSTGRKFVLCNVNVALVKHSELLFFMWSETVVHNTPNSELPWGLSLTLFALFVIFIVNFEMSIGFKWPRQQQNRRKFQKQWDFFNFNKHVSKVHQSSSVWRLWKFTADKTCLLQCIVSVTLRWKTQRLLISHCTSNSVTIFLKLALLLDWESLIPSFSAIVSSNV